MTGTDCRGREDCRQELVILRCKYFLPNWKKDLVARCTRGAPGSRLHFECKLDCLAV